MRTGRPTTDKKDKVVKVRLTTDMLTSLESTAKQKCISVSELIRECIRKSLS